MDEKDLVRRSKDGDEEAFGALVNAYKTKVFNMAFSLTRNREIADDLAQEVFIKAYFSGYNGFSKGESVQSCPEKEFFSFFLWAADIENTCP